jgi:outer membrane protein, multidrug efflux system
MRQAFAPFALLILSACATVGPDYRAPEAVTLGVPDTYYGTAEVGAPADLSRWWETFDDPLLTRLVEEATAGNLDLAVAAARLTQARESLVQARAGRLPSAGASGGVRQNIDDDGSRTSFSV